MNYCANRNAAESFTRETVADAVGVVDHRRHSVESETVELELIQIVVEVRQQEPQHLRRK